MIILPPPLYLCDWPSYPLPSFLEGRCDRAVFAKWLDIKAETLLSRDRNRGKPYAVNASKSGYKQQIYKAVVKSGDRDPYTDDPLAWELIGEWDTASKHPDGYKKKFALIPTVDHASSDAPDMMPFFLASVCQNYFVEPMIRFCMKIITPTLLSGFAG